MVGPLHVNTPHAYLTPIVNVTSVEVVEAIPDVIESPQPRYSSHGMTSNDSRNRIQNTSGGNSSSGSSGGSY